MKVNNLQPNNLSGNLLRRQFTLIQKAQSNNNIRSHASMALSLDSIRKIGNYQNPDWDDFCLLNNELGDQWGAFIGSIYDTSAIVLSLSNIVENINPSKMKSGNYEKYCHWLMNIADGSFTVGQFDRAVTSDSRNNAAYTMSIIFSRFGDKVYDQNEITRRLLGTDHIDARKQASTIIRDCYEHDWRKYPMQSGVVEALRKERDNEIRWNLVKGISIANPEILLESYNHSAMGDFILIDRINGDPDIRIEINASSGIVALLEADSSRGSYYDRYNEKPGLSTKKRIKAFSYARSVFERLNKKDNLSDNEVRLLLNSTNILASCISLFSKDDLQLDSGTQIASEVNKLAKNDLSKMVGSTSRNTSGGGSVWGNVQRYFDLLLIHYFQSQRYPIDSLETLGRSLASVKAKSSTITRNVDDAQLHVLNRAASGTKEPGVRFQSKDSFNTSLGMLLAIVGGQKRRVSKEEPLWVGKVSALNTIDSQRKHDVVTAIDGMSSNGVIIAESSQPLFDVISLDNRESLCSSLQVVIASGMPTIEHLMAPNRSTLTGYAIDLHRRLTRSYKDYFGMRQLKEVGYGLAAAAFRKESLGDLSTELFTTHPLMRLLIGESKDPLKKGILLSGPKGTGKSYFAQILANEFAMPLFTFTGSYIKDGLICFPLDNSQCTIKDFCKRLLDVGPCVLLLDEIDGLVIGDRKTTKEIIESLELLGNQKSSVIKIATTNFPGPKIVNKAKIDPLGNSDDLDRELRKTLGESILGFFVPSYLFHLPEAGADFGIDYVRNKIKEGFIEGEVDESLIIKLCKNVPVVSIQNGLDQLTGQGKVISSELYKKLTSVKKASGSIQALANKIEAKVVSHVSIAGLAMDENIDFINVAMAVENLPITTISSSIDKCNLDINEKLLIRLIRGLD